MKRFILFVFSIFFIFSFAIAQDGINYQGAATDANGDELTTQNISLRASILSGSASGNLEWEETHSTTTDQFGLFNIVIGQGTNTTNGATATFDDMDWGSGNHFLKIEMDASGGTNYAMIGTTQMMSVPYALYAKSAGIDSTMLANMIGSSVGGMGGGCDYAFPEGLDGDAIIINIMAGSSYTVPAGKNFYITNSNANGGQAFLKIGGFFVINDGKYSTPMIAKSGDIIEWVSYTSNIPSDVSCIGILVNQNPQVEIISIDLMAGNYTVPSSKKMVLYHACRGTSTSGSQGYININGQDIVQFENLVLPLFLNAGDIVSVTGSTSSLNFAFGYLVDENYFANCGGGGGSSSSASAVDSAMVAGMIANSGGGGSFGDFKPININWIGGSYYSTFVEALEDEFILVSNSGSSSASNFEVWDDTLSQSAIFTIGSKYGVWTIPVKKGQFWRVGAQCQFCTQIKGSIPLESGGGSASASTSSAQFNNQISNYNNILDESINSGVINYLHASWPTDVSFNYTVPAGKIMKITDIQHNNVSSGNPTYINGQQWGSNGQLPTLFSEGTQIEIQFDYTGDAVSVQYDLIDNTAGMVLNYLHASWPTDVSFNYTVPAGKIMKITDIQHNNVSSGNPTYINGQQWGSNGQLPTLFSEGTQIEIQFDYTGDGVSLQYILFDN